jgi:hypothetical protein
MLPATLQIPAAAILLVGGLVACLFGYRLFRLVLAIYGFVLGAMIATTFTGASSTVSLLLVAVVGGLVGALILNLAYFLGVVLLGAAIGAMIVTAIWGRGGSGAEPHVLVVILFAVAGAVAAMLVQRYVIIVATAFGGAWTALVGGLTIAGSRAVQSAAASAGSVWVLYPLDPAPGRQWVPWVWLVLGLVGLVVQIGQGSGPTGSKKRSRR